METLKKLFDLVKQTFTEWNEDNAPRLAAAIAYYTAFSIAPLLIIIMAIVGFVVSEQTVQEQILTQVNQQLGEDVGNLVGNMIDNASNPSQNIFSAIIGLVTLLFGATGIFIQLQGALNTIWGVEDAETEARFDFVRSRLLSFGMLLVIGFLLFVSLVASTVIASLDQFVADLVPGSQFFIQVLNTVVSLGLVVLLFGLIYKFLPDAEIAWRDVWVGAAITALLFTIGKMLLGLYLGNSGVTSMYGAAGSLIALLLWVYYSAQIVLFGAEFTQVYARRYGSKIVPVGE